MAEEVDSMEAFDVVLAPALVMLLGSVAAMCARVPDRIQACTQNFSAGLLISAVAGELYPLMSPKASVLSTGWSVVALTIGFMLGLGFMFGLERLTESDEDDDSHDGDGEVDRADSHGLEESLLAPLSPTVRDGEQTPQDFFSKSVKVLKDDVERIEQALATGSRETIDGVLHEVMFHCDSAFRQTSYKPPLDAANMKRMKDHLEELRAECESLAKTRTILETREALKRFSDIVEHIHGHAERGRFQRWKPASKPAEEATLSEKIPWPLVTAVIADAGVDGLLIGLAFAAQRTAGWAMSIATCIEMGFLGLSFCATMQNVTRSMMKIVVFAVLPPIMILASGIAGTHIGSELKENPAVFVGFIAFAIVALLFLVTQELLAEAREVGGDSMTINIMLFAGLLAGIWLGKFLG